MSEVVQAQPAVSETAINVESPLHYFLEQNYPEHSVGANDAGIVIREAQLRGHLNLRGNPENELFVKGVESVLGIKLPTVPGHFESNGVSHIYWLGPTEWLVIVTGGSEVEVETRLRESLQGHFVVVDVSGGQTLINISGEGVDIVLKKSSGYDFHPSRFEAGRCVQTTFAKATALVSKKSDGSFDLVIRRSFADYLAQWLLDAAKEFGCRIIQATE